MTDPALFAGRVAEDEQRKKIYQHSGHESNYL